MALYRYVPSQALLLAAMTGAAYEKPPVLTGRRRNWRAEVDRAERAGLDGSAPAPLNRTGLSGSDLLAAATFVSSAVRDPARIDSELVQQPRTTPGARGAATRSNSPSWPS